MAIDPKFAIEAERIIQEGDAVKAVGLCLEGISTYPDYYSAKILLCAAYSRNGDIDKADRILEDLRGKLNYNNLLINAMPSISEYISSQNDILNNEEQPGEDKAYEESLKELKNRVKFLKNYISDSNENSIAAENILPDIDDHHSIPLTRLKKERSSYNKSNLPYIPLSDELSEENSWDYESISDKAERMNAAFENNLEILAKKLEDISIPDRADDKANKISKEMTPGIITETMAKIYESQGAYEEAIKAYTYLSTVSPDKKDQYERKIKELKASIS